MGRNKFIDKKKSATFQLLARDSSDPNYDQEPNANCVFIRVDNNQHYSLPGFGHEEQEEDPNSIFADADQDVNEVKPTSQGTLPDSVRREILELGFPDDGYNYLHHLREISNTGGGSTYYENSKAKLDQISLDVKAYDASRVRVSPSGNADDLEDNVIYSVAAKTIGVRVQKAVDPEVLALLNDDNDLSRFDSDVEDLEEDFVGLATIPEQGDDSVVVVDDMKVSNGHLGNHHLDEESECVDEKPRIRRPLDEQFDLLTLQEYGTESDSDHDGSVGVEDECLADKLNHVLIHHVKDDLEFDDKYRVPADLLHENVGSKNGEVVQSAAEVIRRCAEYAQMYDNENEENDEVVILEESRDETELWDCETIVSTYSNLDNHPGKIEAPWTARKKKLSETVNQISLRGKGLPVDYLPHSKKAVLDKVKETPGSIANPLKSRPHDGESKEEKKERKAAVKVERREARKAKKEIKAIYRCEGQRAQKVAATTGPSAIHLM